MLFNPKISYKLWCIQWNKEKECQLKKWMALYVQIWHDFLIMLSKKEQGVTGMYHRGRSMDRHMFIKEQCLFKGKETVNFSYLWGGEGRKGDLFFSICPLILLGFFLRCIYHLFSKLSRILYRLPSESKMLWFFLPLWSLATASQIAGVTASGPTLPWMTFPKSSQPKSLTSFKILQWLSSGQTLTQHIQPSSSP